MPELRDDASFSSIANHYIANYLVWDEEKDDEVNHAWLKTANEISGPHSAGHYVNEVAGDRYPQRFTDSFSRPNWQRLQSLRKQYDPEGVFHTYLGHLEHRITTEVLFRDGLDEIPMFNDLVVFYAENIDDGTAAVFFIQPVMNMNNNEIIFRNHPYYF